jgi:hypothetical protein
VTGEAVKSYFDANYEQITTKLNKKDTEEARLSLEAVRDVNSYLTSNFMDFSYSYDFLDGEVLEKLFLNKEALTLTQQLELGQLFITDYPRLGPFLDSRIKRQLLEDQPADLSASEVLQAIRFLADHSLGKLPTHLELFKILNKACKSNESEILSPKDCSELLDIMISRYLLRVGIVIERKVEQSLIAARADGQLQMNYLVSIA